MFIDSHAHLFFDEFKNDLHDVMRRAEDAGVENVIIPGTDLQTSMRSIELAEQFDMIYACVGFHPHDAGKADDKALDEIERLSEHVKVVAIGEIGLDYHYNFSPPEVQRAIFAGQIAIAQRRDLPIVIHCREAEVDTMHIVEEGIRTNGGWRSSAAPRGVFHCFPGDSAMASKVIGWNFCISIPGPVTFGEKPSKPNSMAKVVRNIPLEYILLETDCPFLTPVPHRGQRNEPSNIPLIAEKIGELQQRTVEDVGKVTTLSAQQLFGIPSHES